MLSFTASASGATRKMQPPSRRNASSASRGSLVRTATQPVPGTPSCREAALERWCGVHSLPRRLPPRAPGWARGRGGRAAAAPSSTIPQPTGSTSTSTWCGGIDIIIVASRANDSGISWHHFVHHFAVGQIRGNICMRTATYREFCELAVFAGCRAVRIRSAPRRRCSRTATGSSAEEARRRVWRTS